MVKTQALVHLIGLILVGLPDPSAEDCICDVTIQGEYCGTELNRRNANNDCQTNQIYFCGDNNQQKTAKALIQCKDESECQQNQFIVTSRTRRRNPCLRRMKCSCPSGIGRGPHCGSKLVGEDCPQDMLFICRRRSGLDSREVCPEGCNNGQCLGGVERRDRRSDDTSDD